MNFRDYQFTVEACSVLPESRKRLAAYREFRTKCLERLSGDESTAVSQQLHDLSWHTMVFYCLNETRRIEGQRLVNGALWELIGAGYANLMTVGIRRLVDTHGAATSLATILKDMEAHPEFFTRELFVAFDGIPFDWSVGYEEHVKKVITDRPGASFSRQDTKGHAAWGTSEMMHRAFDKLSGVLPDKRRRSDTIPLHVLANVRQALGAPSILLVKTFTDKVVAHAERLAQGNDVAVPSFDNVEDALRTLTHVANFMASFFWHGIGSVVPTPQFDVFKDLDKGWALPQSLPKLHDYWCMRQNQIDAWVMDDECDFLKPSAADIG